MPSIGPTTAFYKVDASLTHTHKEVGDSRQRIAFGNHHRLSYAQSIWTWLRQQVPSKLPNKIYYIL